MRPLRVAVVGAGHLGRIHARLLAGMAGVELVGIADPVESSRCQVAADCRTAAYADHRQLLDLVDAAVIAAPTRFHHKVGLDFLHRGLHLLIEKPLASSLTEAEELVRAARRQGAVLQVGHVERFNPALDLVLPHLGPPKYIEAARLGVFSGRSTDIGVVLDLMIHDIDLVISLVDSPVSRVEALGITLLGGHEDIANARLSFANGCVATLSASRASFAASRTMHIWSRRCFAGLDFAARSATLVRPAAALAEGQFDIDSLPADERLKIKDRLFTDLLPVERLQAEPRDALTAELTDFVESIRQGRAPRVTGEQGLAAMAVADEILARIDAHLWTGDSSGPCGPSANPAPRIIPAPHWHLKPDGAAVERREAG